MPDTPQKKDIWDRVTALATILIPAAIALAGHFISQGLKQAELASAEQRAAQTNSIAESNTKIAQANLINTMMKSLTSTNPQERKLAVQAVLIALPEEGPLLVRAIAENDADASVQAAAVTSLDQRLHSLMDDLYSDTPGIRKQAAREIIQGWKDDPDAVRSLVQYGTSNRGNANGIYNTVVVLNEFSPRALKMNERELSAFLPIAKSVGPKSTEQAVALAKRLKEGS